MERTSVNLQTMMLQLFALLIMFNEIFPFNICNISPTVCVPLRDLQPNCTCILVYSFINVTNETNLYYGSLKIPMELFTLQQLSDALISRLQKQIPKSYGPKESLDLSPAIYNSIAIDEYFWFLTANSSDVPMILDMIVDTGLLGNMEENNSVSEWCASGDCRILTESPSSYNSTTGTYATSVLYVAVASEQNTSVIVVSTIHGQFIVPRLLSVMCTRECTMRNVLLNQQCRRQCSTDIMENRITIVGSLKRDWQNFLRAMVIENIHARYGSFFT